MKFIIALLLFAMTASAQVNISPNMSLPIPIPGVTPGPTWASNINSSFLLIDQHNHSAGEGVQIQPNGLNINSDLTFGGNNATHLRTTRFTPQSGPITNTGADVGELYVSGNEIYYNDVSGGHQVKITTNGSVNAGAGSITGLPSGTASASYSAGTFTWQSATSTAANMDFRSAILRNSTASSKGLTLNPPAAMGADITETLPTIPAGLSFMTMSSAGNMGTGISTTGGITGSMIAGTTIVNGNFAAGTKIPETIRAMTINGTALSTDGFITVNTSTMTNLTLYSAASFPGLPIKILKTSGDFGALTISAGSFSTTIDTLGEVVQLDNDGSTWYTISRYFNSQPVTYVPTLTNVGTGSGSVKFFAWREGHFLNIQGTFAFGTATPNAIPTFSVGWGGGDSNVVIDPVMSPTAPNTYVGTWGSQNTNNAAGCLFVNGIANSTQVSFGSFGAGNKCTNGVNASGIGDSTNVEFTARVPIQGWKN